MTDSQPATADLLAEFARTRSADAFAEIVRQHTDLVYSVARRIVGDAHLAEDVTQATFMVLARKARVVDPRTLPGWLVNTTRLVASVALRTKANQERHESKAAEMRTQTQPVTEEPSAEHVTPLLDEALARLREADRAAVVMRFLQGQSFAEVGAAMGTSEEAARKRVTRALEKLRRILLRRGLSMSVAGLTVGLAAHQASAAPVGLGASVTKGALTSSAGSGAALAKGTLAVLMWTQLAWTAAMAASAILVLGAGTVATFKITGSTAQQITKNEQLVSNLHPVDLLGMSVVDPTDELIKKYEQPEKAHRGPIVVRSTENAPNWHNAPTEGSSFWIIEPPVNGFIYKKKSLPRYTPRTVDELVNAIVASAASPEEYQKVLDESRQLAREHAEKLKDTAARERVVKITEAEMPKEDAGKYICRVVYTYPKQAGTMTTFIRMSKEEFDGLRAMQKKSQAAPSPSWQRFTDPARRVMALADQEAQRYHQPKLGTEHILLGIMKEGDNAAALVLKKHMGDLSKLHEEIQKLPQPKDAPATTGPLPQSPQARQVIEYAIEEARRLNQREVGTECLLLGILREREYTAAKVLENLGVDPVKVRADVLASLAR